MELINNTTYKDIVYTFTIFCYIFSFYIVGPITSSMIVALPFFILSIVRKKVCKLDTYFIGIITFLFVAIVVGTFYSIIHLTFDYSYIKVLIGQMVNMFAGFFIVSNLRKCYKVTSLDVEKYIVFAFLLQSIIEVIASVSPSFASFMLYFNRAYVFQEGNVGVRGLALAAGTGWSLGLTFGVVFIVYVKRFLLPKITFWEIFGGIVLLVGTMFAGRTGFLGAAFGFMLFLLNANRTIIFKTLVVIKSLLAIVFVCVVFYFAFPVLVTHLVDNVFPFAFEPFYRLFYNDEFSTGSTDKLMEMWSVPISAKEIVFGTGCFTDPITGTYYKHIDIGIMRNLFYWGIGGYAMMIAYQLYLLYPIKSKSDHWREKWNMLVYRFCLMTFLFTMEFKAMTIGFNKMAVSVIFLLGYFYYFDNKRKNVVKSFGNNTLL